MAERLANGRKTISKEKTILITVLLTVFCFSFCLPSLSAQAYNRTSAIALLDADSGEILYAENPDLPMEIASTTKILTAIVVIENADVFMTYTIPKAAVGIEGSSIYLREGEKWRVLDLLYGLMLRSGNDAATALAIATSGSIDGFVSLMNQTAKKIGATGSRFTNPHGLHDEEHYSTAVDMARITAYALRCPIFAAICKTKTHRCEKQGKDGTENVVFYNKNKLLYSYPDAIGVKTGYTKHSGRCLVSAAEREGVKLICVTINVYDTYGVSESLFEKYFFAKQNTCEKARDKVS